ncbi:SDR family oxidoreductase [Rhodobacterales bacterium HKCCE3408]|nr:SDR family oxidoreductase [Rhodobacterales bacterium HKCCE3408]
MDISGRPALVVGGSGGLGRRLAERLADAGAYLAVGWSGGEERAAEVCDAIEQRGGRAVAVQLDLRDPASVETGVAQAAEALGGLAILMNAAGAAGGPPAGDLAAYDPEAWDRISDINFRGPFLTSRAAAPHLRAARGAIVNFGSTIGHGTWGADRAFQPTKAAVSGLTRFLAASLAPDVRVNCVAPGLMENTVMSSGAPESFVATWREAAKLKKTTSIEDVVEQALTFCRAETVTGQTLIVDGGLTFR